jgi:hypothetical protein
MTADRMEWETDAVALVEGPAWGDATFYGHWLIEAATANELLGGVCNGDEDFGMKLRDSLELLRPLDFGLMGTVFLSQFADKEFASFLVDYESEDLIEFCLMAEMGFFTRTADRYQMTLPTKLDLDCVKQAHLKLMAAEDGERIHPEHLVVTMPSQRAITLQALLWGMDQGQRLADRRALLFMDG